MKITIDEVLKKIGKTRYWLSKEANISYPSMKYLCDNNTDSVRFENLSKICKALNCEISDILKLSE